jgi:hypothetical protein
VSTLKTTFSASLSTNADKTLPLFGVNGSLNQLISQILTTGTGDNQANKIYSAQISTSGSGYNLNVYNFGGAKDSLGQTYALQAVRLLLIQNLNENNLIVSINGGLGNAWTYLFSGVVDGSFRVSAGGLLVMTGPINAGYSVNSGMNTINIADEFSLSTSFNVIVVGYQ